MRQQEAARFMKKYGMPQGRALTAMNDPRGAEDFRAWYHR
jgi:hypothetical protein